MYVEVIYFKKGMYDRRKFKHYDDAREAEIIYWKTIAKMKGTEQETLICIRRDDNHELIKCYKT